MIQCTHKKPPDGWHHPEAMPPPERAGRVRSRVYTCVCCRCGLSFKASNHNKLLCPSCSETHKFCPGCEEPVPIPKWYRCRSRSDGLQVRCSRCMIRKPRNHVCGKCGLSFLRHAVGQVPLVNLCDDCEQTHKWCSRCCQIKELGSFYKCNGKRSGRVSHCTDCHRDKYSSNARRQITIAKYGITAADWQGMHDAQNGLCAICGKPPNGGQWDILYTDHDHKSGQLRKLLCSNCNKGLGCFGDDPVVLERAAAYLRSFREEVKEVS